jgi:hypothetical protein
MRRSTAEKVGITCIITVAESNGSDLGRLSLNHDILRIVTAGAVVENDSHKTRQWPYMLVSFLKLCGYDYRAVYVQMFT